MNNPTPYRKKLIEVDLPLNDINCAVANEPTPTKGHPWRMHLWWARRPLTACRAVIFASMVDDPAECKKEFPTAEAQVKERARLHNIISQLVKWDNSNNENVLAEARYEIARSVARSHDETAPIGTAAVLRYLNEKVPPIYDPFCGGGSIPLEAQRLGLRSRGSDLNPIPVLITKALVEFPSSFGNQQPINPDADRLGIFEGKGKKQKRVPSRGTVGLADDIRYYGMWMREEAHKRVSHFYPAAITNRGVDSARIVGSTNLPVIAWLWARTVPCSNPACRSPMPLMKTFQLSKKKGDEHWTRPVVNCTLKTLSFVVQNHDTDVPKDGTVSRNKAVCVACGTPVRLEYVREQARYGNMEEIMTAIVAEGDRKRLFLSPTDAHIQVAQSATPDWNPRGRLPEQALGISLQNYGITQWHQLFTERQLTVLTTFSDLLAKVRRQILQDGSERDYTDALCTYLALALSKVADGNCRFTRWQNGGNSVAGHFSRPAIQFAWDFAETNPFSNSTKNWTDQVELVAKAVESLPVSAKAGEVYQADAATTPHAIDGPIIVTDPPYYNNIGYADLSDFFYIWLRSMLGDIYPELFSGMLTPKGDEIVAAPRFKNSRSRFENLLYKTLQRIQERCADQFPSCFFYAYKQQEEEKKGRASTGWETMLTALTSGGFQIVGTWPMRTERSNRSRAHGSNTLASSVVLVCRPRPDTAANISLGGFLNALRNEMPAALDRLTHEAHIAPVDLAQAAIGPGMEVYSRYKSVKTTQDGKLVDVSVREALVAINNEIDRYYEEQEGEFDSYTRFCLAWFKQHGFSIGEYGDADVLARANDLAIAPMQGRVLNAERGKVQLFSPDAYDANHRNAELSLPQIITWEACHLMVYHLNPKNEEGRDVPGAAEVGRAMQDNATSDPVASVERLARILYSHYDRQGNAANAVLFNNLVTSWEAIESQMRQAQQGQLEI